MADLKNILPGEVLLEEFLQPMGISAYRLSKDLGIRQTRTSQILAGFGVYVLFAITAAGYIFEESFYNSEGLTLPNFLFPNIVSFLLLTIFSIEVWFGYPTRNTPILLTTLILLVAAIIYVVSVLFSVHGELVDEYSNLPTTTTIGFFALLGSFAGLVVIHVIAALKSLQINKGNAPQHRL